MHKSTITIRDVAKAAGVSVSTVSRVLNDRDGVSPTTYQRVRQVIEELNYASNLAARSMRLQQTGVIGVVAPDLRSAFTLQVIRSVSAAVEERGYELLVFTSSRVDGEEDQALREQRHVHLLNSGLTDGTIVLTPHATTFPSERPVVVIDPNRHGVEVPAVLSTNYAGARAAMAYLFELGHRRIGFVGGRPDLQSAVRRWEGYRDSLMEQGISLDPTLVCRGDFTREGGYACGQRLLSLAQPPTAIFAANDESAIGVLKAARDLGVPVPQALSVVGFDNITESAWTTPPLTTVDQALEGMGQAAVDLLFESMAGKPVAAVHKVATELVIRESCGPPAR
ncbi:LacI family transcriptional regulator [Litorilinea aerophila]|uniref:LacI family transcriptional regulator n=1 Tax=Litorilinea aerophila TaxID=1204385 RepID=A0A540VF11_9CHLR|nr:LacI family DNA-binding transcriptional regulator [Litorilinea aerophila]MCC9076860.1 LacI family transcriptional regulator [Litorilinea aerophila]OUC09039.1 LacI family transcriptional regulator [Litorilinea aerophila]GIV78435.1 MAG: LacI family transcriptional regulator [Litorilinea sp.]